MRRAFCISLALPILFCGCQKEEIPSDSAKEGAKKMTIRVTSPVFEARPCVQRIERQPETERQKLFNVIGENDVAVPTAFFKIVVDVRNQQNPDVLAFLVPHIETVAGPERRIETYLTSINQIEELSGLDFLTNLPENVQEDIESVVAARPW